MDIATYNQMERLGQSRLSAWRHQQIFSPIAFDQVGFPARIDHIGQVRGLLSGMHDWRRIPFTISELDGLREEDLGRIGKAVATYLKWFRSCFPDEVVPVPLGDILAYYLAYLKLSGLDRRSRVLEIGPGYGHLALFLYGDEAVQKYDMIEITQSLYVIQASLCAFCYGEGFRNAALSDDAPARVGSLGDSSSATGGYRPYSLSMPRSFNCTLYPWWELDQPLSGEYDVIVSNSNIVEMSRGAFHYYLENWKNVLTDSGYVLIQDIGHSVHRSGDEAMKALDKHGYRALAKFEGPVEQKHVYMWNLVLVTERHPEYERAKSVLEPRVLLTDNPVVRKVFGLDRPPGKKMAARDILQHVASKLSR